MNRDRQGPNTHRRGETLEKPRSQETLSILSVDAFKRPRCFGTAGSGERKPEYMARRLFRYARLAAGWALLAVGIVMAPTPLPVGYLLVLVGLSILVHESRFVRNRVRRLRERYPGVGRWLNRVKHRAPGFARRLIERTEPLRQRVPRPLRRRAKAVAPQPYESPRRPES